MWYDVYNAWLSQPILWQKIRTVTMINDLWRQLWFKTLSLINVCKLICTCDRLCNLHLWPSKFMYVTRVVKCICDLYYWYAIVTVYLWLVTCLWLDLHLWYVLWSVFVTFLSYVCHMCCEMYLRLVLLICNCDHVSVTCDMFCDLNPLHMWPTYNVCDVH